MANKIGRFEILSEITHSEIGAVYKAADAESGQTIALKTIQLHMLAEQADTLMQYILQEAAGTSPLSSHNIAQLIGVEQIDTQCCAAMEYVQGNSIATMLARKEGFSIWDLQDIVRQTCQGLDHAHSHNVVHYSLEPAKIMVTWDGTVKVLSFGVSCMGAFTCQASGKAPEVLHYVSPEQLRGDPVDGRSNIFSLGAILYEMATETKAFPGDDADQVRQAIVETTPPAPIEVNRKIHPVLSEVIMKALSKAAEDRYQSGQELVNDLERCKESTAKVVAKKSAQPAQGLNAAGAAQASPRGRSGGFQVRRPPRRGLLLRLPRQRNRREGRWLRRLRQKQPPRPRDGKVRASLPQSSRRSRPRPPQARQKRPGKTRSRNAPAPWPRRLSLHPRHPRSRLIRRWRKKPRTLRAVPAFPK